MSTDTPDGTDRTAYVIVGGGLAAAKAIEGIRESDTTGRVVLVAEEDRLPYERPPLSKGVLKGDDEVDSAFTHDRDWYAEQGVELRLGNAATSLDAEEHALTLADGDPLGYERLLLATGSSARALDVPGRRPRRRALPARAAGVRGAEGAPSATAPASSSSGPAGSASRSPPPRRGRLHASPSSSRRPRPCSASWASTIGGWFADLHRGHGVEFRFGEGVERIEGDDPAATGVS